ncbi:MAG: hypothetical protein U0798_10340 [Gemmataceae bacterium]
MNGSDGTQGSQPFVAQGDLTTASDVDVYQVSVPGNSANPSIVVQTGNLSSVQLKVSVFKHGPDPAADRLVMSVPHRRRTRNGNYLIPLSSSSNDVTYFVRVQASSNSGKYDIGSYLLATEAI